MVRDALVLWPVVPAAPVAVGAFDIALVVRWLSAHHGWAIAAWHVVVGMARTLRATAGGPP